MIKILKTGMCEGCPRAELELIDLQSDNGQHFYELRCSHHVVCEHYERQKRTTIEPPFDLMKGATR